MNFELIYFLLLYFQFISEHVIEYWYWSTYNTSKIKVLNQVLGKKYMNFSIGIRKTYNRSQEFQILQIYFLVFVPISVYTFIYKGPIAEIMQWHKKILKYIHAQSLNSQVYDIGVLLDVYFLVISPSFMYYNIPIAYKWYVFINFGRHFSIYFIHYTISI